MLTTKRLANLSGWFPCCHWAFSDWWEQKFKAFHCFGRQPKRPPGVVLQKGCKCYVENKICGTENVYLPKNVWLNLWICTRYLAQFRNRSVFRSCYVIHNLHLISPHHLRRLQKTNFFFVKTSTSLKIPKTKFTDTALILRHFIMNRILISFYTWTYMKDATNRAAPGIQPLSFSKINKIWKKFYWFWQTSLPFKVIFPDCLVSLPPCQEPKGFCTVKPSFFIFSKVLRWSPESSKIFSPVVDLRNCTYIQLLRGRNWPVQDVADKRLIRAWRCLYFGL